jgi:triosephosphate isomerase
MRKRAGVRILYGGSMKPDNAQELMAQAGYRWRPDWRRRFEGG